MFVVFPKIGWAVGYRSRKDILHLIPRHETYNLAQEEPKE